MRARRFEIISRGFDFVIEVEWLDGSVEHLPGLFDSDASASDCLTSEGFVDWLRKKTRHHEEDA